MPTGRQLFRARANVAALWHTRLRPRRTFVLDGVERPYLRHRANATWRTERTVEIPIALDALRSAGAGRVLEVGNVLTQYAIARPVNYTVVDKYEVAPRVANIDVLEIKGTYDLIVSISTLEHVGLDEMPRDWQKARRAVIQLRRLLAPSGAMLATWPLNYNRDLDDALRAGELGQSGASYLRRVSGSNLWMQATIEDASKCMYGFPWAGATALALVRFGSASR
jgi:hypothetical protein